MFIALAPGLNLGKSGKMIIFVLLLTTFNAIKFFFSCSVVYMQAQGGGELKGYPPRYFEKRTLFNLKFGRQTFF
jgi:hypothetical protein